MTQISAIPTKDYLMKDQRILNFWWSINVYHIGGHRWPWWCIGYH